MADTQSDTDGDEGDTGHKRTTMYLRPGIKRNYERWQLRLELNHTLVEDALKRQMHEAIVATAIEHQDTLLDYLEENFQSPEEFGDVVDDLAE